MQRWQVPERACETPGGAAGWGGERDLEFAESGSAGGRRGRMPRRPHLAKGRGDGSSFTFPGFLGSNYGDFFSEDE